MASATAALSTVLSSPSRSLSSSGTLKIKTRGFDTSPLASPTIRSPTSLRSPVGLGSSSPCNSPRLSFSTNTCASPHCSPLGQGSPHFQTSTASESPEASFLYVNPQNQADKPATLYDVLGISEMVSDDEIKAAFRFMAKRFHPDCAPPEKAKEFQQKFMEVHKAYSILKDPRTRSLYNFEIRSSVLSSPWRRMEMQGQWRGRNWETDQCWTG